MTSNASSDPLTNVDDVLITAELASRPSRAADHEAESRALGLLAEEMATNPRGVLQRCAELVMELCHADSAGISILEPGGTSGMLRWRAAAGAFAPNLHGTMPAEASPCGTVIDRNRVLLFQEAERFFPALRSVEPRIYENLLTPWHAEGKAIGTLWAIKHTPNGRFDAEDARVLQSLARFTAAAFQMTAALDEASAERAALQASEQQLRDVLDSMSEGFALFDTEFRILDVNAETVRLDGRRRDELVGRNHWEAFPGSADSPQGEMFKRVMRTRTREAMEHSYSWPDGKTMWVDTRAYPTTHGNIAIQWRDITERKLAEQALRESESKYRTLFETMGQGYCELELIRDGDGRAVDQLYLQLNPAFERMFGIAVADAQGRRASELFPYVDPKWTETFDAVARTQTPQSFENEHGARWYETFVYPASRDRVVILYEDIDDRKRAEERMREGDERQAFLLRLSDNLRAIPAEAIIEHAVAMLAEELRFDLCYIVSVLPEKDRADVIHQLRRGADMPEVPGVIRLSDYPKAFLEWQQRTLVSDDMANDPALTEVDRRNVAAMRFGALIAAPVRRGAGNPIWSVVVVMATPRRWTASEVALIEEAAERTWAAVEHARAEAAIRDSEERFRQFSNASAAALWIRQADTLTMEFVSPAIATIYGTEPDRLLGDLARWAAMIVPEDRETALSRLQAASAGETVTHEFRIQRPTDGAFRWIRNTSFPLRDDRDIPRVGGIAEDVTEAKLAVEHQGVLLAELQHRVRNIMAMIRSMARRSADGAADVEEYRTLLEGRLLALARVQALLTRHANTGGSLRDIVESEVGAQAHGGGQYELVGPDVQLSPKVVEVLTLALHELSTNALKYGALSVADGRLRVEWAPFEKRGRTWLGLDWVEQGVPPRQTAARRGFGSDLIEGKIPYELGGSGKITIETDGARCRLELPLKESESILETDAPSPITVFGGMLDMSGAPDLTGRSVLVVEDDYYIAGDTAAALRGAGATVLGPCPSEDAALDLLDTATPTHAVLDLNLGGGGPRFEIAHALKERGISFVFLTGYDPDAVPPDLVDVVRLQKPVTFSRIVEAVAQL
ncbi:PAS domain S-box protein [uncultured Sphingomonas sp.]|uniref:PAS domain S-box protein n=1 Tax=uncultured Sphingomonas sp. TaxID=158754 RepID=UPI002608A33B|nr:PAS domain S-box protein [uncultured Sphingomonas sp.]